MIGIDLGTTNSVIAIWKDGQPFIIPDVAGRHLTPSVVGIDDDGSLLVGEAARNRLLTHPDSTVATFKRRMGTTQEIQLARGKKFRAEELSGLVLRKLIADAESFLGETVRRCVVSVPAYFNDTQRKATRSAAALAGLDIALINEPTAAAIAYGIHERLDHQKLAVVDLGGGTLDVSILEFFEGVMEVHATAGDNFLGGEDFDDAIVRAFLKHHGIDGGSLSSLERSAVKTQAMRARHTLTTAQTAAMQVKIKRMLKSEQFTYTLSRAEFEALCVPLLDRFRRTLERALKDARLSPQQLDEIILVGGATRMPVVRSQVARLFGRLPLSHMNPDEIIAAGAAIHSAMRENDAALEDFVLTDVCPYSLGIEVAEELRPGQHEDGYFLPIIERNTPIPVSRAQQIQPVHPKQTTVQSRIFQGESRRTSGNVELGSIEIEVPRDAVDRSIDVRFTYDTEGLLEVIATVNSNDQRKRLVINNSGRTLTDNEIRKRFESLNALKVHPRDVLENRTAMTRAERLYEESLGEKREAIAHAMRGFETSLARQDHDAVGEAREGFMRFLDQFDQDVFR